MFEGFHLAFSATHTKFHLELDTIIVAYEIIGLVEEDFGANAQHGAYFVHAVLSYCRLNPLPVNMIAAGPDLSWLGWREHYFFYRTL